MDRVIYQELLTASKKNYMLSQVFTYITGILVLITLYLYYNNIINKYESYFYYAYLAMAVISIIISFNFNKKLKMNNIIITEILQENKKNIFKFTKNGIKQGCINAILIIILVGSFFVKGTQLDILNDLFFIIIIFSYWVSNRFYFNILSKVEV
ncbi:MAG TPA: hypothetical protein QF753_07685 [Victivallales bacterium]|nr:hypothetical protein [Victivallales bacterium]